MIFLKLFTCTDEDTEIFRAQTKNESLGISKKNSIRRAKRGQIMQHNPKHKLGLTELRDRQTIVRPRNSKVMQRNEKI